MLSNSNTIHNNSPTKWFRMSLMDLLLHYSIGLLFFFIYKSYENDVSVEQYHLKIKHELSERIHAKPLYRFFFMLKNLFLTHCEYGFNKPTALANLKTQISTIKFKYVLKKKICKMKYNRV